MLKPSMYQIIGKDDSYYEFVVAVAQRARDIAEKYDEGVLSEKPVKLAVEEFAGGKIRVEDYI
ncbi:MAG: DNA-directed RNA polymerase subunit omega [Oscillospiraceae bacterium]|nr:DNA-directed RNA polymerase subunit omega [Oscillospiraceae bacterium]